MAQLEWPVDDRRDQVVLLRDVPWAHYQALLRARGESPQPRMAYLDGELQIMTTAIPHELDKTLLARLVEAYAEEAGVELNGAGNPTFAAEANTAGFEPDECYWIGAPDESHPELAIEIVHARGRIDTLEIYRRFGVREVWLFLDGEIAVFVLDGEAYARAARSRLMPKLDLGHLTRLISAPNHSRQTQVVRAYRRSLQKTS